ncbi:MAG: hypothetical protein M3Q47_00265 [Actinomycetota bacterium]|nr:hypothetical protein [Actinomycetota bacterium]
MTYPIDSFEAGRLAANARMYEPDELLDRAADLFENNRPAWERLPARTRDRSVIHKDMRDLYRAAVRARLIPDDRGPAA